MSTKVSKHKFLILFLILFSLNSCGGMYSCNFPPKATVVNNSDPCNNSKDGYKWGFKEVKSVAGEHSLDITLVIKGPCSGSDAPTFALSFYDATNIQTPNDLENIHFPKSWMPTTSFTLDGTKCIIKSPTTDQMNGTDIGVLVEGDSVTFGVGANHKNVLYPYYIKTPLSNGLGKNGTAPGTTSKAACYYEDDGATVKKSLFAPFAIDDKSLSPVYDMSKNQYASISPNGSTEVPLVAVNIGKVATISAPFYTFGTQTVNDGITSSRISTDTLDGSIYHFKVFFMQGATYKVTLSEVDNPAKGMSGDFSLTGVQIYTDASDFDGFFDHDYSYDGSHCNKKVDCGTTVTVN